MNRREFSSTVVGAVGAYATRRWAWADDLPADVKITRIVGFDLIGKRPKLVGKNSRLDVHGDSATDRMVRLVASDGTEGIGSCRAPEENLRTLLGRSVTDFYRGDERRMAVLGREDMPAWDLVGKLLGKPAYEMFGSAGREEVPVYDGSIYFADLLPGYEHSWRDRFKQEIDMGLERGHRMFKVKVGRGNRWMSRAEGDRRDIQVVRTIRKHGGARIGIGVDANNGYDLAGAKQFVAATADLGIAFTEEMFPETVEDCLALKAHFRALDLDTLLADGEGQRDADAFTPFIDAQAMDVLQGDMRRFGFEEILREAEMARPQGILIAPHNWGSMLGYYMQLHIGRAISNFYAAEQDPAITPALVADGYKIENGVATVPDTPGFGLSVNQDASPADVKLRFDLRS